MHLPKLSMRPQHALRARPAPRLAAALLALTPGLALLGAHGAAQAAQAAQDAGAAGVRIEEAWIRWLPANLPAGGYLVLSNGSDQPRVLVGASSPDYGQVQLHRSITQGGLSKMVPVPRITIPAHSTLSFAAHGYHLMLMQPQARITPGDHVPITLRFADGQTLLASFQVRPPSATAPGGMAGMPSR